MSNHHRSAVPLCVRLPNWVGDVCMALPALALLRRAGYTLQLLGKGWAADLLAGYPDKVTRMPPGLLAGANAMSATGAEQAVLLTNSFASALQAKLGGLAATGYARDGRSLLLSRAVTAGRGHEVEAFWRLACSICDTAATTSWNLGVEPYPRPPPRLALHLHERHQQEAVAALKNAGVDGAYMVLCPLAVGTSAGRTKVWPGFAALSTELCRDGFTVVACPGPGEEAATAAALPGAVLLPGLGLGAYAAILASATGVVANDSGPMHLAAAVDAPIVGVFGVSDPERTRPWGIRAMAVGSAMNWPDVVTVRVALVPLMRRLT